VSPVTAPAPTLRTARCACRRASITLAGDPEQLGVCHCANCRRRTGSAFGISAYFARTAVRDQRGALTRFAFHHAGLQHEQERFFCSHCGSTLLWHISTLPQLVGVAGGCFDEGEPLPEPRDSLAHHQKLPWVGLPPGWTCSA
jgi:hypothetical protein